MRLKSVTNIQKITQSMKMVSAAKYARAERELRQARPYGEGVKVNRNDNNINKNIVFTMYQITGTFRLSRLPTTSRNSIISTTSPKSRPT